MDAIDLVGRILFAHRLSPMLAVCAIGLSSDAADALVHHGVIPWLEPAAMERAALFASIMTRLEIRCRHDSRAIHRGIGTPLVALGGATIVDALAPDLATLRRIRAATDEVTMTPERWWRVGH